MHKLGVNDVSAEAICREEIGKRFADNGEGDGCEEEEEPLDNQFATELDEELFS